jgi:hypothetical protein
MLISGWTGTEAAATLFLMEHRDIQFSVVQTANPVGWKWTVQLDATRTRSGVSPSMKAAIFDAQRKIDKELKRPRPGT